MTVHAFQKKEYITDIPFEIKQIDDEIDSEFFVFEGFASTFGNVDLVDDEVSPGAFSESLQQHMPVLLWQHDSREPIGMPIEVFENQSGLVLKGKLPKSDTFVSGRVIPQMKVGSVRSLSIGFSVADFEMRNGIRVLKKINLFEVSLVTFPANPMAKVSGFKSVTPFQDLPLANLDRSWDSDAAISRVREFTNSSEAPSEDYFKAFLWWDLEDRDNFGAYKLPYADVIDGRLTAIPRALSAAKAAVSGARGGVDIPEADKEGVLRVISRYEEKLEEQQASDESSTDANKPRKQFILDDVGNIKNRIEFDRFLKRHCSNLFSNAARDHICSLLKHESDASNPGDLDEDGQGDPDVMAQVQKKANELNSTIKSGVRDDRTSQTG